MKSLLFSLLVLFLLAGVGCQSDPVVGVVEEKWADYETNNRRFTINVREADGDLESIEVSEVFYLSVELGDCWPIGSDCQDAAR